MSKETFEKTMKKIYKDYKSFQKETEQKITDTLILAGKELGDYFLSKGFVHVVKNKKDKLDRNFYYDPKTKIGIKVEIPEYIDLEAEYNSIGLSIVYKVGADFLFYNRQVYYFYKNEDPEKTFKRFKKFNGKAESTRMKNYLREMFPKEMLVADRNEKLKNIKETQG